MARLEVITRQLEGGQLTLEEALRLYEEAAPLRRRCDELLSRAEAAIKLVITDAEGNQVEEPFRGDDEPDHP